MMESKGIPVVLCFNKKDIAKEPEIQHLKEIYESCGYQMIFTSALEKENIENATAPWKDNSHCGTIRGRKIFTD